MSDPLGLIAPAALAALAPAGISAAGLFGTAVATDIIASRTKGEIQFPATKGVARIMPELAGIVAAPKAVKAAPAAIPYAVKGGRAAASAAGASIARHARSLNDAWTEIGQRIGAAMEASKVLRGVKNAAEFGQGYFVPGIPAMNSKSEMLGNGINRIVQEYQIHKRKSTE